MRGGVLPALALAGVLLASCRPAGPRPEPTPAGLPAEEPLVRVGIAVDTPVAEVSAAGGVRVMVGGEIREELEGPVTFSVSEGRIVGRTAAGAEVGPYPSPVAVRPTRPEDPVRIGGQVYRGAVLLRAAGASRITAINVLELEDYLLGVVPLEIGPRTEAELEAVKAQAVAARTYAVGHLGSRGALGFDFFATTADQVYGGLGKEDPVASRAVRETRGEIVAYEGGPILAYYHSTCGGRTAALHEVWNRAPLPYLQPVSDRIPGTESYYCEISNRFRWTVDWRADSLAAILSRSLAAHTGEPVGAIEEVASVEVQGRTPSGRAEAVRIVADGRDYVVRGDSIRWVLRPEPGRLLNSILFELEGERGDGGLRWLRAEGGGWGHGIGMCQMGAIGRARAGQDYRTILTSYYRGTEVVRLY